MKKEDTIMRKAIPLDKRVAIALYRLATSAKTEQWRHAYPPARESKEHLRQFGAVTEFPQCLDALDGAHIKICPPKEHATDYYNYKWWYSPIIFAVVDHLSKFMYLSVGSPGKNYDAAVFESSRLPKVLASELFPLETKDVEGVSVCPVLLGDQAFPFQCHLVKPFSRAGPAGSFRLVGVQLPLVEC
ncbi:hypothetical protein MRX96_058858 [Rhipicephalus microplus]